MAPTRQRLAALARLSLRISRDGLCGEPAGFAATDVSRFLPALAVLALEGERPPLDHFVQKLKAMAVAQWGVDASAVRYRLGDCFCMRSVVEAYHGLIDAGLIPHATQDELAPWLYELALVGADGRVERRPEFLQWHQRNQNVPATMIYNVAWLLDQTRPGQFDTRPLWDWADRQIVGWNLTWRSPDDSWLYQYIWTWSAYLHARYRRPDLLRSENARRSIDYYRHLSVPGLGVDMVFGDAKPGDLVGAMVSLVLGANLFRDGQLLFLALRLLDETERRGIAENLVDRAPEFHRLYALWPLDLEPQPIRGRRSMLMLSPLAGRGWSFHQDVYEEDIKGTDLRYPFCGQNTHSWDPLYQVQDPAAYADARPDKLIFAAGDDPRSLFAVADLRAHGLHDHADALGIVTLVSDGVPWLVESSYLPYGPAKMRWLHNVPLIRPGRMPIDQLKHWRSDTWREAEPGGVRFEDHGDHVLASACLAHDGYDYVPFTGCLFDVGRTFLYVPDRLLLVVDRLIAVADAEATVGQIWHTPAEVDLNGKAAELRHRGRSFHASFAQSAAMERQLTSRQVEQHDAFYYPPGRPVRDLLIGSAVTVKAGDVITMAACFARQPTPLALEQDGDAATVTAGAWAVHISGRLEAAAAPCAVELVGR